MDSHPLEQITIEQIDERLNLSRSVVHLAAPESLEIITLEQFALKMQVGESTGWKWIKSVRLKPGRHYIQIERVSRLHWCRALMDRLLEDCCSEEEETTFEEPRMEEASKVRGQKRKYGKINFDI